MEQASCISAKKLVTLGRVGAPHGINGWVKINSYTSPKENIINFRDWYLLELTGQAEARDYTDCSTLENYCYEVADTRVFGDRLLVLFRGICDRNSASLLTNKRIVIDRARLPVLDGDQYYWIDLIGMSVYSISREFLGVLDHIVTTKANDIMMVKKRCNLGIGVAANTHNTDNVSYVGNYDNDEYYLIPYKKGEFVLNVDQLRHEIVVNWAI